MKNPPENVGPYTIDAEIGQGAMGVVYRARDNRLNRTVALKSLHEQVAADADLLARFTREAQALAALNHPNIAGIHGLEAAGDHHYLVLEYVAGETLAQRLTRGPLDLGSVLDVCTQIAAGLEAAHEAGIIHRDLKPDNLMITADGTVKMLDFGLARNHGPVEPGGANAETMAWSTTDLVTTAGTLLGTVPYMSPEQARGEPVDQRADIWALTVIIHECLTGSNPFAGPTAGDVIAAILTTEVDFDALPPGIPSLMLHILRRGLQRSRRSRWRNAGDVRLLLEECRESIPAVPQVGPGITPGVDKTFLIDDEICRTLEPDGFDPHLLGWHMQYADNERPSRELQVWVPSFGEDHSMGMWRDLLAAAPCRAIIATPVGFEPGAEHRPHLSMTNQLALLRHLVISVVKQMRPDRVVVGGFSCGADMALRCAADDQTGQLFDGVLAVDPNLSIETCVLTGKLSQLDPDNSGDVVRLMQDIAQSCDTVEELVSVQSYVLNCVDKLSSDLTVLVRQCRDIATPFMDIASDMPSPFVQWFRQASENTKQVRCIFADDARKRAIIAEVRMQHMQNKCLGGKFTSDAFVFIPGSHHLGLMRTDVFRQHMDELLGAIPGTDERG